jgi:DNA polymerase III delta subunit
MPKGQKTGIKLFYARLHVIQNILLRLSDDEYKQAIELINEIDQTRRIGK